MFKRVSLSIAVITLLVVPNQIFARSPEERSRPLTVAGKVTSVNAKQRTLTLTESGTGRTYRVLVPQFGHFKVTAGSQRNLSAPEIGKVVRGDQIECKVRHTGASQVAGSAERQGEVIVVRLVK